MPANSTLRLLRKENICIGGKPRRCRFKKKSAHVDAEARLRARAEIAALFLRYTESLRGRAVDIRGIPVGEPWRCLLFDEQDCTEEKNEKLPRTVNYYVYG